MMSYIRAGDDLRFVYGRSESYIYPHVDGYIKDYGKISDKITIELLFRYWETEDHLFKDYLLKNLAKRLHVRLRDKPLKDRSRVAI